MSLEIIEPLLAELMKPGSVKGKGSRYGRKDNERKVSTVSRSYDATKVCAPNFPKQMVPLTD